MSNAVECGESLSAKGIENQPDRIPIQRVFLTGSLMLFGSLCVDMYLPAFPAIQADLHASTSAVQLSLSTCLIGLALGQLVFGVLSDRFGRRGPLLIGMSAFVAASVACAAAPNIGVLIAFRFVQGLGAAAGTVISLAVVRDHYSGATAARLFSRLMLVLGVGPILGPPLGSWLAPLGSWRLIFVVLAGCGGALALCTAAFLPESLPPHRRSTDGIRGTVRSMRRIAGNRTFLANACASGLLIGALFAYIAGSAFAIQSFYGLSAHTFSLIFALNSVALISTTQLNAHIVVRFGAHRLLAIGLGGATASGFVFLILTLSKQGGLGGMLACFFMLLASAGLVLPNSTALALNNFPDAAGSASALLGVSRFAIGAGLAPLVGLSGDRTLAPLAIVVCASAAVGHLGWWLLVPRGRTDDAPAAPEALAAQV